MTAGLKYTLLAVVFLLGYTSMSFELLVLRQLINFVGSNTLITSVVYPAVFVCGLLHRLCRAIRRLL